MRGIVRSLRRSLGTGISTANGDIGILTSLLGSLDFQVVEKFCISPGHEIDNFYIYFQGALALNLGNF